MRYLLAAAGLAAAALAPGAWAQDDNDKGLMRGKLWPRPGGLAISLTGGAEFTLSNDFTNPIGPVDVPVSIATPDGSSLDVTAQASTVTFGFDAVYGATTDAGAEISYGLTADIELFASGNFQNATGGLLNIGSATAELDGDPAPESLSLTASQSRFRSYGVDGGLRYYFFDDAFRPFIAVRGGVQFTESISIEIGAANPFDPTGAGGLAAPLLLPSTTFLDASTEYFAGADVGFFYAFAERWGFAVEVGFRWTSAPEVNTGGLAGTPFAGIGAADSRISIPLGGRLQYRF